VFFLRISSKIRKYSEVLYIIVDLVMPLLAMCDNYFAHYDRRVRSYAIVEVIIQTRSLANYFRDRFISSRRRNTVFRIAVSYPRDSREIMLIEITRILPRARTVSDPRVFVRGMQFARFLPQRDKMMEHERRYNNEITLGFKTLYRIFY